MKYTFSLTLLFTLLLFSAFKAFSTTRFVKPVPTGTGDGSTWMNASDDLQSMISASGVNDTIWVAQGTYRPTLGTDQNITFSLKNGVSIFGGFVGDESTLAARNWAMHNTILSGDIGIPGNTSDNSFHVISNSAIDSTALLDGFTITGGGEAAVSFPTYGGGVYNDNASPTIINCLITSNYSFLNGGGMYNFNGSSPTITNCTFTNNASRNGGAMYNQSSSPKLLNCTFQNNLGYRYTGGMYNSSSSINLTNCTFSSNSGGGMYNNLSSSVLSNCSFISNFGGGANQYGAGGLYSNTSSSAIVTNCIFISNSGSQGGGMQNGSSCQATLSNCIFNSNSGGLEGGGLWIYGASTTTVSNCSFRNNSSTRGGGVWIYNSSPDIINCIFKSNSAQYGGGVYNWSVVAPKLKNCSLSLNTASVQGGGLYNDNALCTIVNSVFWNNTSEIQSGGTSSATVTYSIVKGLSVYPGVGNLNADPLFINPDSFQIQICSPAIDAGIDIQNNTSLDFDGNLRKFDAIPGGQLIDIGAYEFQTFALSTFFKDQDNDGFGNPDSTIQACSIPSGYVSNNMDCNDGASFIHPGALDTNCNGIDEDCDGIADDDYTPINCLLCQNGVLVDTSQTWYLDADGDGHAISDTISCTSPGAGYYTTVLPIDDCNDSNANIHPGADDNNCNGIDEDCDGIIDEGDCYKVVTKAILGGAYFAAGDTMSTLLQIQNMIPSNCPYDTTINLNSIPLNMVDWVILEIVDTITADTIYASQCGCLLRDGSIQNFAGDSTLSIAGMIRPYVSLRIKHRNHLSTRSIGLFNTLGVTISFDFRSGTNLYMDPAITGNAFHNVGQPEMLTSSGRYALWPGDANGDGQIKYQGSGNDRGLILSAIGGTVITNTISGYLPTDINLNGQVKYQGSSNDRGIVLSSIGGSVITKITKAHN